MLSPSDANIDAVLFFDELTGFGPDHRNKDEVEFASLRAVDRQDLVIDLLVCEVLGNRILLSVVWSDHIHGVLCELHQIALLRVLAMSLARD